MNNIPTPAATRDIGKVILIDAARLPAVKPAATADAGKITLGGAARLPASRG